MGKPRAFRALAKALSSDVEQEWEKEDFMEAVYWIRQIIALVGGLTLGWFSLTGLQPFLGYLAVQVLLTLVWYQSQRSVDLEEFGGQLEVGSEGFGPSLSLFLMCWIVTYSIAQA